MTSHRATAQNRHPQQHPPLLRRAITFASADRADVLFDHRLGRVAVEVKAAIATEADMQRGIYQCVKYQALVRAELKAEGKIPNGWAVLVTERTLLRRNYSLAKLLGVPVIVVNRQR